MSSSVALVIKPRTRNLGGFEVARVLPYAKHRMVGPFIFFDRMGPSDFPTGEGINVRPHPHIGLATVTYLFDGEIMHRDDLGYAQAIRPGDVNWMTAGRGIVHSERTRDEVPDQPPPCSASSPGSPCRRTRKNAIRASSTTRQTRSLSYLSPVWTCA